MEKEVPQWLFDTAACQERVSAAMQGRLILSYAPDGRIVVDGPAWSRMQNGQRDALVRAVARVMKAPADLEFLVTAAGSGQLLARGPAKSLVIQIVPTIESASAPKAASNWPLLAVVLLGLGLLGMCSLLPDRRAPLAVGSGAYAPPGLPADSAMSSPLEVSAGKWSWHDEGNGYCVAQGRLKNLSGEDLPAVEVIVTVLKKDGTVIANGSSYVEADVLASGASSAFKVYIRNCGDIAKSASLEATSRWRPLRIVD